MGVILVDEDADFRGALAENLRDDGYVVREYGAPGELPVFTTLHDAHVLVTDYQLRGEDGLAFADRFHDAQPAIPVLMLTAFWTEHLAAEVNARDFLYFLGKPIDYFVLRDVITQLSHAPGPFARPSAAAVELG